MSGARTPGPGRAVAAVLAAALGIAGPGALVLFTNRILSEQGLHAASSVL